MTSASCQHYEGTETRAGCSAPLCPQDPQSMQDCTFFPGEEICRLRDAPEWVRRQRRIDRAAGGDFGAGSFTVAMLSHPCLIRPGIKGLDPETEITPRRVREWIAAHPAARVLTDEQRAAVAARLGANKGSGRARTVAEDAQAGRETPPAPEVVSGTLRRPEGSESGVVSTKGDRA